jgi:hypothetical protein
MVFIVTQIDLRVLTQPQSRLKCRPEQAPPMVAVEEAINFPVQLVHFLEKIPVSHDSLPPVLDCVSG